MFFEGLLYNLPILKQLLDGLLVASLALSDVGLFADSAFPSVFSGDSRNIHIEFLSVNSNISFLYPFSHGMV